MTLIAFVFKTLFVNPTRAFLVVVLLTLALAGGAVWTFRAERDAARADLAAAKQGLERAQADNRELSGWLAKQNAAVQNLYDMAVARADQAAKADAAAQVSQAKYSVLAGKILAQEAGPDQCASLHSLRQAFVKERP